VNGPIVGGSGRDPRHPAVAAHPHTDSFRQHQLLKYFFGAAEILSGFSEPAALTPAPTD